MTGNRIAAGIIAAGLGSRLKSHDPKLPKPLVCVSGKPLVYWVVSGLRSAGVESITILLNTSGDAVRKYLEDVFADIKWSFLRKDTASSWESFRLVSRNLAESQAKFLVSTVDALIPPAGIAHFARQAFEREEEAMALTRFVEDEKPLWADTDAAGRITALGERASQRTAVTCGLYALSGSLAAAMPAASKYDRLRDYWSDLIHDGQPVRGVLLENTVDVDRPEDLPAAEKVITCFGV